MEDNKNLNGPTGVVGAEGEPGIDYVQAINDLKANSVPKDQYTKLKDENARLLKSIINGEEVEIPKTEVVDINALRQELFTTDNTMSSLEYITKALKLRDALIEKGEPDPFLPIGENISATNEDIATANKVAAIFAECVEYADGDPAVFANELMRRTTNR